MEAVDGEFVADLFQQAQLGLIGVAVCGGHITGQGISGFKQIARKVIADQAEKRVKAVFFGEEVEDG